MFVLKSCPRCGGDINLDLEGEMTCLQCGHELKPEERRALLRRVRVLRRARSTQTSQSVAAT